MVGMVLRTERRLFALHVADCHDLIRVPGARVNNLKDVSVEIPKRRLTVFTGVSGSGKSYLMTQRIERAMALLRRGDLTVTEACFAVGCSSLGTFSTRFTELVGVPPSTYRRQTARATAGMPSCVAKQMTRPIRNREAPVTEPHLA